MIVDARLMGGLRAAERMRPALASRQIPAGRSDAGGPPTRREPSGRNERPVGRTTPPQQSSSVKAPSPHGLGPSW
jgi:hypothetical protein